MTDSQTVYYVCDRCAHVESWPSEHADEMPDRCENCRTCANQHGPFEDLGTAEDLSQDILDNQGTYR
jgi:hypothetical protein